MKIKEITEDNQNFGRISAVANNKVTIQKTDGSSINVDKSAVLPGTQPNTATIDSQATGDIKPGTNVMTSNNSSTSEEMLPDTVFAGSKVGQKAGVAGQARGTDKAPFKGKLVGAGESMDSDLDEYQSTKINHAKVDPNAHGSITRLMNKAYNYTPDAKSDIDAIAGYVNHVDNVNSRQQTQINIQGHKEHELEKDQAKTQADLDAANKRYDAQEKRFAAFDKAVAAQGIHPVDSSLAAGDPHTSLDQPIAMPAPADQMAKAADQDRLALGKAKEKWIKSQTASNQNIQRKLQQQRNISSDQQTQQATESQDELARLARLAGLSHEGK